MVKNLKTLSINQVLYVFKNLFFEPNEKTIMKNVFEFAKQFSFDLLACKLIN